MVGYRRRSSPGALPLVVYSIASAIWMICYGMRTIVGPHSDSLFWVKLSFLGVCLVPASFLVFSLQYINRAGHVTRRTLCLLAVEPLVVNIGVWTDPWHGLVFNGWAPQMAARFSGGPLFWAHAVYSYGVTMLAFLLLGHSFRHAPPVYRIQSGLIIAGAMLLTASNIWTVVWGHPFSIEDISPIGLAVCGAIVAVSMFRRGMADLVPIARDAVLESMGDGVLVLDRRDRIVDLNPASRDILGVGRDDVLGKPIMHAFPAWEQWVEGIADNVDVNREICIDNDRHLDLRITVLSDGRGRVAVLRDITMLKNASVALTRANETLRLQLQEIETMQGLLREQAMRDPLTGLYNRRFMQETLNRHLVMAGRSQAAVSIVVIDLDHFKHINDSCGHAAGDQLLKAVSELLHSHCRSGDIACRFGGEEFIMILEGTPAEVARHRAEEWRVAYSRMALPYEDRILGGTLSAGIASFPQHGQDVTALLRAADRALYAAKEAGRNRVEIA